MICQHWSSFHSLHPTQSRLKTLPLAGVKNAFLFNQYYGTCTLYTFKNYFMSKLQCLYMVIILHNKYCLSLGMVIPVLMWMAVESATFYKINKPKENDK